MMLAGKPPRFLSEILSKNRFALFEAFEIFSDKYLAGAVEPP